MPLTTGDLFARILAALATLVADFHRLAIHNGRGGRGFFAGLPAHLIAQLIVE